MPFFETKVSNIIQQGDADFYVPRSSAMIKVRWSLEGVIFEMDRGDIDVYINDGRSKNLLTENGFVYKWPESQSESELSLSVSPDERPFAKIQICFISDISEWNNCKKYIRNKGDCFQMEFADMETAIIDSVLSQDDVGQTFDRLMGKIEHVKSLSSEGILTKEFCNKVLKPWSQLAYQLAVCMLASDNCSDKAVKYVKSYLKSSLC